MRRLVVAAAVELLEVDPALLGDDTAFEVLGVDSLALVELALALEEVLDVELPEEEVAELDTVGALVDALAVKRSAGLEA
ncbi:MAG: Phosphopantetheine attachment site [Frankiales bacterium]|nr:Phosphopantetheine attachment site [Frankiales bacterium]